ncbi:class I SAM-dependent methyltransferase [Pseudoalteromonas sp. C2R02]|uniref:class I SAM-dependent methyltransferase n=1 Tax=Pseudoalteromonas sp. C2R02 TaxID=2841565 RepID=UPI001C09F3C2|nr:class I SAM-dependent methyltransferase [Pseudoalteromonas sp. C2R02]MBU2967837.1 class I SAM-dependent methyltransferase [Pseudoalteromonas sp. C2R02]
MTVKDHWENVYTTKSYDEVSWFQSHSIKSLELINSLGLPLSASLIDVGGGASILVDDLIKLGYSKLQVLDLSLAALKTSQERLGDISKQINWIEADITDERLKALKVDLWHDRAVFHFLTDKINRQKYINNLTHILNKNGHVIIATFAEDGPEKCSGLDICRYNPHSLALALGECFTLVSHHKETHQTPFNTKQNFIYCHFIKN